jgi:hypothetical protein
MAGLVTRVASATGKRGCLKTVSKTELAIGLMRADTFWGKNGCLAANCIHKVDGSCDTTMLLGGRVGVL